MRVFRSTFKQGDETRKTRRWYVEVTVLGRMRRMAAFTDKTATAQLGQRVERLAEHVEAGSTPPSDLARWIDGLSARVRAKLTNWGLLDKRRAAMGQTLDELLDLWRASILDRGRTEQHADLSRRRSRAVLDGIGASQWGEIAAEPVEQHLADRRRAGLSAQSSNHMLTALRGFTRWMVRTGRATADPLARVETLNVAIDRRRVRRALTRDEARRLVEAAERSAETVDCLDGETRALVYRIALGTGLRRAELARLRVGDFDLARQEVALRASATKSRRAVTLPLPEWLCTELAERLAELPADRPALPLRRNWRSDRVIGADLDAAGIARTDERGRVVDFHALRATYISWIAARNAQAVAQALARHSSGRLTQEVYTDLPAEQRAAVAGLPDLRSRHSARHSADALPVHGASGAAGTRQSGGGGGGTGTRTQESRICNP